VITAMVTPFNANLELDRRRAGELARRLVDLGSEGILVGGTTGESPTLTEKELLALLETVLEAVGDRAFVIAGTGSYSTARSVCLTRKAEAVGVHAVLLVVPYYSKPPQEGLRRHFETIAQATRLPVMLYNIPGRTSTNMLPETVAALAEVDNIVAVKESSGDLGQAGRIVAETPPEFLVYSGDDNLTLPIMAVGGHGVVSVASHLVADRLGAMIEAYVLGDTARAQAMNRELTPLFRALFVTTNPIPIKAALRLSGFDVGGPRLPLVAATPRQEEVLAAALRGLDLLAAH